MREGRFRPAREGRSGVEGRRVGRGDWEIWELGGGVEGCWERWIRRKREKERLRDNRHATSLLTFMME